MELARRGGRRPAVGRFGHHLDSVPLEQGADAVPEHRVIIGQDDLQGHHSLPLAFTALPPLAPPTPFLRGSCSPPPPSRIAARPASAPTAPAPVSSPHTGAAEPPGSPPADAPSTRDRSEERRVGKECMSRSS